MVFIIVEFYVIVKKNESMIFMEKWIKLGIMLDKISWIQKNKQYVFYIMWGIKNFVFVWKLEGNYGSREGGLKRERVVGSRRELWDTCVVKGEYLRG